MIFRAMRFSAKKRAGGRSNVARQGAVKVGIGIALSLSIILTAAGSTAAAAREEGDVTIVILGDRTAGHREGIYEAVVEKSRGARGERPDLYVTIGDQIEGYTVDEGVINAQWREYFRIVRKIRRRLLILPGNHDVWSGASEKIWSKRTKRETSYSTDYDGIHLVLFENGRWMTLDSLPEERIDWLVADLKAHRDARLTLVFLHRPYWYLTLPSGKADRLHEIFTANGVDAVFSGHLHRYGSSLYDGIYYTMVGSSGGSMEDDVSIKGHFYSCVKVEIKDDDLTIKVVPLEGEEELPADFVTIEDLKFFDRIEDRYVVPGELFLGTESSKKKSELRIDIENNRETNLPFEIKWETKDTGWEISPKEATVEIPAGEKKTAAFSARLKDNPYPLPRFKVTYPYRRDRSYDFRGTVKMRRVLEVPRITGVTVDGRVDGGEWENAVAESTFSDPKGMASLISDTLFLFGRDKENLYVLASCMADTEDLVINAEGRDGDVFRDDSIGLFISPDPDSGTTYQLFVNPLGVILDRKIEKGKGKKRKADPSWDSGCVAGAYISPKSADGFYQLELKIPLSAFGADPPKLGEEWGINFGRLSARSGELAKWQYHKSIEHSLGRMVFGR
ncbi:MAG: metallophosphoesterase [Deltaproteobacteria bacterium]|uniref:Metallophosphoesterase n=1 Tax=Candidatus Zymogenus saltonus TaxID=2844893 RepID=A0A9D8KEC2_9DELT|nr:metallophosphoesterase [Candidatus Zymogenus saltonus]